MKPNLGKPNSTAHSAATAATQAQAKLLEGLALHQKGQWVQAQDLYQQVLKLQPEHLDALHLLGVVAYQTKNPLRATELIGRAIGLNSNNPDFHNNYGLALKELNRLDEALESYDQAIKLKPDYAGAYLNRGNALKDLKQMDEALASYRQAIRLKPDYAEAYSTLGNSLQELMRWDEALASLNQAITLKPDYAEAYYNRGITLHQLKRLDEALQSYDQAVKLKPDYAAACSNRGVTLHALKRWGEALASLDQAIKCTPEDANVYCNRGNTLQYLRRLDEALESYDHAIKLKPDYADAYYNRGDALLKLGRYTEAVQTLTRLLELAPDYGFAKGRLLHSKMLCCDWTNLGDLYESIKQDLRAGKQSASPFGYQGIADSERDLRTCAEIFCAKNFPKPDVPIFIKKMRRHAKIRIGYVSGEFRNQATSILMAELWELHDKNTFDIFAFDNGWDDGSHIRARIKMAFNEIIDITQLSDRDAASLIGARDIDILVNLNGYFGEARQGIFSYQPSPIQVNYLGFPGTTGADYIDYLIADSTVIPIASRQHYAEKIVYLPNSYQVNDRKRAIADKTFSREDLGLPSTGFVFCCFNNNYKITPGTFDGWMRILKQVTGSVLWLFEENSTAVNRLRNEAEARGVNAARLIFAKHMPLTEHLARHRAADLFLDTLPYNAHTTASDALWAGLPLLTCTGQTFPGRVAASLLNAIELPELITTTQQRYEALAVELATDPQRLEQIRHKLQKNRLTTPLFDAPLFTRHIEAAYTRMVERYQAGLPPEHIDVTQ